MNNFLKKLNKIDLNLQAKNWTWLSVGGAPLFHFFPNTEEDLSFFIKNKPQELKYRTFGAGSNILIRDKGYNGAFIRLKKNFRTFQEKENELILGAGLTSTLAVTKGLEYSYGGYEFIYTIPGQIGGLIKMNAGAYGQEMKDIVNWVEFMDENGNIHRLKNHECNFSYRKSGFKNEWIILRAAIKKNSKKTNEIKSQIEEYKNHRNKSQPTSGKMAGCFFKNHSEIKAWEAIKKSGITSFNNAFVSNKHANFLTANENTSSFDIEYLIEKLRSNILFNQSILLESEVEKIGEL